MAKHSYYYLLIILLFGSLLLGSCSNTKYLTEQQTLYVGNKIIIQDTSLTKKIKKSLADEITEVVRPKPNSSFLGIRFKLYLYNIAGTPKKKKGLRAGLRNKFGEAPVLGSDLNLNVNTSIITNFLENQGYLHAYASGEKETKNKRTKAIFKVNPGAQSKIKSVNFLNYDSLKIGSDIKSIMSTSFLKTGEPYNLDLIEKERQRISDNLKVIGYYYFNPDYLLIVADTGIGKNQINLTLKLKLREMPDNAFYPYTINNVVIVSNYRLNNKIRKKSKKKIKIDSLDNQTNEHLYNPKEGIVAGDTIIYKNFKLVDKQRNFKPKVFDQAMQLKPGELYNKSDQNLALNRLVTLGTFRFVKNEFTSLEDSYKHLLNLTYLLTPAPKKSISFELGGFSKDDNKLGTRASVSWRNRNFLKGAELFTVKPSAGLELQYGGGQSRPSTYNVGLETSLNIPRFIVPFVKIKPSGMFIPRTLVNLKYDYTFKANYYRIYTYSLGLGYNWKEDIMKDHKLFPINISYVRTDTLNRDSLSNVNLSNLIYNGLIIGPSYEYTFNSQLGAPKKDNFYFFGAADFSGNIVGGIQDLVQPNYEKKIFNATYAQYVKLQTDFRYYHDFSPSSSLAARIYFGFGYSYGNSYSLPNIKQFFSGGSSSLRGFASRLVGPGTFNESYDQNNNSFVEMLGDMKGEFNIEWRKGIYRFIKGAVFFDAGNIWLLRDNPDFPGGKFSSSFYKELAADAGLGLRLDFSILILRLDFGIPVRKPWFPEGQRWRFNDIHFGDPTWRKENLILNIAIGYPF